MSGETQKDESGWTTDTLFGHMQRQINDLKTHIERQITDLRVLLDERYATQTRAVDAAFIAQSTAMATALTAAERAVATALLSAEKAVGKAEAAADKRFESVNEFRAQLADQAATFLSRSEADARITALGEKQDSSAATIAQRQRELAHQINEVENRLTSRLDLSQGTHAGATAQAASQRLDMSQMVAIASLVLLFVAVGVSIVVATR